MKYITQLYQIERRISPGGEKSGLVGNVCIDSCHVLVSVKVKGGEQNLRILSAFRANTRSVMQPLFVVITLIES